MADKKLALYIKHEKNFKLRDLFDEGENADWQSGSVGIVVEAGKSHSVFPRETTKDNLRHNGFVIIE